jgi:YD repeat-containing protein
VGGAAVVASDAGFGASTIWAAAVETVLEDAVPKPPAHAEERSAAATTPARADSSPRHAAAHAPRANENEGKAAATTKDLSTEYPQTRTPVLPSREPRRDEGAETENRRTRRGQRASQAGSLTHDAARGGTDHRAVLSLTAASGASVAAQSGPRPTPHGPPITPPGQQQSALADPLFVVNWNDGLTMFPGVKEFDVPVWSMNRTQDLRAQVYGSQVQSYSWNTTQAPNAGCVIGQNSHRLRFSWNVTMPSQTEMVNTISVTATMTGGSTLTQSLTFVVAQTTMNSCMGMGNDTTAWPTVITPDREQGSGFGVQGSAVVASDSATRPYGVSHASGTLYVSHSLPSYSTSPSPLWGEGWGEGIGLVYASTAAERRPIFLHRYEIPTTGGIPNTVSSRLQFNGSWGPSKYYQTGTGALYNPGDVLQIALQADAGSLATGRYNYTVETTANYTGYSSTTTASGVVTIVNEETSPFGEGWSLDLSPSPLRGEGRGEGLFDRLHIVPGGVILNQGAGHSLWFAGSGPNYTTPAGDFSTLTRNMMDGTYTRTLKNGVKQHFNAAGMQTSLVDRNNNTITFAYTDADSDGAVDELASITDANGLATTLAYPGTCGAGVSPARVCTITDPAGRVTSFLYNAAGQLIRITDPDAAQWNYAYDTGSGRMTSLVDPRANATSVAYNFAGRVGTSTRPDGTTEQFKALQLQALCDAGQCTQGQPGAALLAAEAVADYTDPRGNAWDTRLDWWGFGTATQVTNPLGQANPAGHMTVVHRDANGVMSQSTDRLSRNHYFTLDAKGNPTKITNPDLTTQLFQYNSFSQPTQHTNELGKVTTLTYDAAGNLTQIAQPDPDGGGPLTSPITTFVVDTQGRVTSTTNPRGFTTAFSYDTRDRLIQTTLPDDDDNPANNPTVLLAYDAASNVTSRTDERGYATTFTYDAMGRPLTATDPLGHTTTTTYDAAGNVATVRNALNQTTTLAYNSMNRAASVSDPLGNLTNFDYDAAGNVTTVADPLNRVTTSAYNALGYQTSTTSPLGFVTTTNRDAEGQVTSVVDPLGRTTTVNYNNRGWETDQTDPASMMNQFQYNGVGLRTWMMTTGGGMSMSASFTYDDLGRMIRRTDELNNATNYEFDSNGNRTAVIDPLGHRTSFGYDARDQLISVTTADPDGAGPLAPSVTTYTHDAAGNQVRVTDPLGRQANTAYDAAGRRTSITDAMGGVVSFGYDHADRMTSLTDPVNNTTSWTIDAAGRTTAETDPLGKSRTFVFNAVSELVRVTDRNNRTRDFVYDSDGRRTSELWCGVGVPPATPCSNPLRTISYTYNAASELTQAADPDSTYAFTYDTAGRVLT